MVLEPNRRKLFEDCVSQCADSVYRVSYRLTGDETLARDLVQETYLNAWKSLETLQDPQKLKSWMFAILRNQYSKMIRTESKAVASADVSDVPESQDSIGEDELSKKETADQVQQAIQKLDEPFRLPVLLVSMEGMSVEEAAGALDLPRGTVLSRLHRGREKLKSILTREFALA